MEFYLLLLAQYQAGEISGTLRDCQRRSRHESDNFSTFLTDFNLDLDMYNAGTFSASAASRYLARGTSCLSNSSAVKSASAAGLGRR
jgi:hypothetical protein